MDADEVDVVIVGAGLSGLNSAYLLQTELPDIKYTILERRSVIGGTWAFWKYPGARSDSSSAVFRFAWHPWPHDISFPDAPLVQAYAADAARAHGIDQHIRFQHSVGDRRWSSADQMWTVDVTDEQAHTSTRIRARWLINCSGYYSYEQALQVDIPGLHRFRGEVCHPQFWSDDISLAGKRVVLLGSGATAVTMLPHIAKAAQHTTMVQRSPSYVLALPRKDAVTAFLRRVFVLQRLGDYVDWYRQILIEHLFVYWIMAFPRAGRAVLRKQAQRLLPADVDVDVHFNPAYNPFEQRLCMSPDADFFRALHRPDCAIVTGTIDTVTPDGVRVHTRDGGAVDIAADMIITATGLHVELLNGRVPIVDGTPVDVTKLYSWRSCMVESVPNFCFIIGYTTGTWTPGADAHFRTVLAVMKEMRRRGATAATPTIASAAQRAQMARLPVLSCSAGYLQRARDRLPISSGKYPWTTGLTYFYDVFYNYWGNVRDGMKYTVPDASKEE